MKMNEWMDECVVILGSCENFHTVAVWLEAINDMFEFYQTPFVIVESLLKFTLDILCLMFHR